MELNPLIARVAVLRAELRAADRTAKEARDAAEVIREKLHKANRDLEAELLNQIDSLDPVDPESTP